jgi:hypothetical protein
MDPVDEPVAQIEETEIIQEKENIQKNQDFKVQKQPKTQPGNQNQNGNRSEFQNTGRNENQKSKPYDLKESSSIPGFWKFCRTATDFCVHRITIT